MPAHGILKDVKTLTPGLVLISGKVTLGASGAVSSTDIEGATLVKTGSETGRYTLTLNRGKVIEFRGGFVSWMAADDSAVSNTVGGSGAIVCRDDDISSDGTVELQFTRNDTSADAELPDGTVFHFLVALRTSSVS